MSAARGDAALMTNQTLRRLALTPETLRIQRGEIAAPRAPGTRDGGGAAPCRRAHRGYHRTADPGDLDYV